MAAQTLPGESAQSLRRSRWYLLLHFLTRPETLLRCRLQEDQPFSWLVRRAFLSKPSLRFISFLTSGVSQGHSRPLTFFKIRGACLSIHRCSMSRKEAHASLMLTDVFRLTRFVSWRGLSPCLWQLYPLPGLLFFRLAGQKIENVTVMQHFSREIQTHSSWRQEVLLRHWLAVSRGDIISWGGASCLQTFLSENLAFDFS